MFKKGDKKKAENYRTVSLTCVACKVLESIVRDKLMFHMKVIICSLNINLVLEAATLVSHNYYIYLKNDRKPLTLIRTLT